MTGLIDSVNIRAVVIFNILSAKEKPHDSMASAGMRRDVGRDVPAGTSGL
jgi:hypothetical protein